MLRSFVYAANNHNGLLCARRIRELGFSPVLLLLHPKGMQSFGEEIRSVFPEVRVVEWFSEGLGKELADTGAEFLLSVNFAFILPEEILSLFRYPVNLHTGYLPFNKGRNPNVWSIVDGTPAGVTLHLMTNNVDDGEIIARREVPVSPLETGKSLYAKLEEASVELIGTVFSELLAGEILTSPMPEGGTFHFAREFDELCALSLDETVKVGDLLRRLRALSFPPYRNAYFMEGGRRVYVDISLDEEEPSL
ncbi:MAG: formyl transferase [Synergistaceae bacterium]|nr:formyl transferase [Synergistaceae bacterium]